MPYATKTIPALLLALSILAGCGQKGPLFLPGDPSSVQTDVPNDSAPDEQNNDDEDESKKPESKPENE